MPLTEEQQRLEEQSGLALAENFLARRAREEAARSASAARRGDRPTEYSESWDDVQADLHREFPDVRVNPDQARALYQQTRSQAFRQGLVQVPQGGRRDDYRHVRDRVPVVGSLLAVSDSREDRAAFQRIRGGEGTQEDYRRAQSQLADQEYQGGRTALQEAFDITTQAPGFVAEMAATGPIARGVGLAARGGLRGLGMGRGLARTGLQTLAGEGARTLVNVPRLAANVSERLTPEVGRGPGGVSVGEDPGVGQAIARGVGDTLIENLSERAGGMLPGRARSGLLGTLARRANFNGIAGEVFEERVGEVLRGLTGVADNFGATGRALSGDFAGAGRQIATEALGIGAFSGAVRAADRVRQATSPGMSAVQNLMRQGLSRPAAERAVLDTVVSVSRNPDAASEIPEGPIRNLATSVAGIAEQARQAAEEADSGTQGGRLAESAPGTYAVGEGFVEAQRSTGPRLLTDQSQISTQPQGNQDVAAESTVNAPESLRTERNVTSVQEATNPPQNAPAGQPDALQGREIVQQGTLGDFGERVSPGRGGSRRDRVGGSRSQDTFMGPMRTLYQGLLGLEPTVPQRSGSAFRDQLRPFDQDMGSISSEQQSMMLMEFEQWATNPRQLKPKIEAESRRLMAALGRSGLTRETATPIRQRLAEMAWMWDRAERVQTGGARETPEQVEKRLERIRMVEARSGRSWATMFTTAFTNMTGLDEQVFVPDMSGRTVDDRGVVGSYERREMDANRVWEAFRNGKYRGTDLNRLLTDSNFSRDYGSLNRPEFEVLVESLPKVTDKVTDKVASRILAFTRNEALPDVPTQPAPEVPPQVATAREELARKYESGQEITMEDIKAAATPALTEKEWHVLHERFVLGRTLDDIATDRIFKRSKAAGKSSREAVRQAEQRARQKLGITQSASKGTIDQTRREPRSAARIATKANVDSRSGEPMVNLTDVTSDPREVAKRPKTRPDRLQAILDRLVDEYAQIAGEKKVDKKKLQEITERITDVQRQLARIDFPEPETGSVEEETERPRSRGRRVGEVSRRPQEEAPTQRPAEDPPAAVPAPSVPRVVVKPLLTPRERYINRGLHSDNYAAKNRILRVLGNTTLFDQIVSAGGIKESQDIDDLKEVRREFPRELFTKKKSASTIDQWISGGDSAVAAALGWSNQNAEDIDHNGRTEQLFDALRNHLVVEGPQAELDNAYEQAVYRLGEETVRAFEEEYEREYRRSYPTASRLEVESAVKSGVAEMAEDFPGEVRESPQGGAGRVLEGDAGDQGDASEEGAGEFSEDNVDTDIGFSKAPSGWDSVEQPQRDPEPGDSWAADQQQDGSVESLSEPHAAIASMVRDSLGRTEGLTASQRREYENAARSVLSRMPVAMAKAMQSRVQGIEWFASIDELGATLSSLSQQSREVVEAGNQIGGAYSFKTGTLYLDGRPGWHKSAAQTYAHEFAHAVWDSNARLREAFAPAWKAEIADGQRLGKYAAKNVSEGFAELARFMYSQPISVDAARRNLPKSVAILERFGFLPASSGSTAKPLTQIFSRPINDNGLHGDELAFSASAQVSATGKAEPKNVLTNAETLNDYILDRLAAAGRLEESRVKAGLARSAPGTDLRSIMSSMFVWNNTSATEMIGNGVFTYVKNDDGTRTKTTLTAPITDITEGFKPEDLRPGKNNEASRLGTFLIANHVFNEVSRGESMLRSSDEETQRQGAKKVALAAPEQVQQFREFLEETHRTDPEFFNRATVAAKKYTDVMNATRQALVEVGYHTQEEADRMAAALPDYVPLARVMEEQDFKVDSNKRRKGSSRKFVDPFVTMRARFALVAHLMHRQVANEALWNGGTGATNERNVPGQWKVVETSKVSADDITNIDRALEALGMDEDLRMEVIGYISDPQALAYLANAPWNPNGENKYTMRIDGKPVTIEIEQRPLYDMLTGQQGSDSKIVGVARAVAEVPGWKQLNGIVKGGATSATMVFPVRNLLRDPWHYYQNVLSTKGWLQATADLLAGHAIAFKEKARELAGKEISDPIARLYFEAGGEANRAFSFVPRGKGEKAWREATGQKGTIKSWMVEKVGKVKDVLELIGAGEHGPRLAEFESALAEMGYTRERIEQALQADPNKSPVPLNATIYARGKGATSTVDFAHTGIVPSQWNKVAPFFGSHIAGMGQEARNWKAAVAEVRQGKPGPKMKAMAGVLGGIVALEILHWLNFKDEEWYSELNDNQRYNWWILAKRSDGSTWGVPKPQGIMRMAGAYLTEALRTQSGSQPRWGDAVESTFQNATPRLTPVGIGEYIDVQRNRGAFGRPIVPQSEQQRLDATEQFFRYQLPYVLEQMSGGLASPRVFRGPQTAFRAGEVEPSQSVESLRERFEVLERERRRRRAGEHYPREAEYQRLNRLMQQIGALQSRARGDRRIGGRVFRGDAPPAETVQELRRRQIAIARRGLGPV